jgi:curved DNA-binding protein CbpA
MDDYYALLGVDPGAGTDEIRTAYRDKKSSLGAADNDSSKADAARLNKAWNTLSDPYQRGRYDERLAKAEEDGDVDDADEVEVVPARASRGRGARQPAGNSRQANRRVLTPTIDLPAGTRWPENRRRIAAMLIDLTVLLFVFILAQYVVFPSVAKATNEAAVDRIQELNDQSDAAHERTSDLDKKADASEKKADAADASTAQKDAAKADRAAADAAKKREENINDDIRKENAKLFPTYIAVMGGAFFLGLLYLVIPSALTGRTLGKRFQRLKVLRQDGSPITWADAFRRYGLIIIVTFALTLIPGLGPLGAAIVLIGVTRWMSNPNKQGLHDRFAKTIVVADNT